MVLKLYKHSPDLTSPFCKWCTHLGGDVLQLDPLRLTICLSLLDLVSKENWKGKGGLGPCKTSTALTHLGGDVLQLDPLRLTICLSLLDLVSKENWKGKGGLGPCKTSTALRWKGNLLQVHLHTLIAFLLIIDDFGEAMGFLGQDWSRFGA